MADLQASTQASSEAQEVAEHLPEARPTASAGAHAGPPLPPGVMAGFVIAVVAIVVIATLFYTSLQARSENVRALDRSQSVVLQLERLLSLLKDAESGQRGYLLVGNEAYLDPYTHSKAGLGEQLSLLRNLVADDPAQNQRIGTLGQLAVQKMEEIGQTIAMHRAGNAAGATDIVRSDRGKVLMDRIRTAAAEIGTAEQDLLTTRQAAWRQAGTVSLYVIWGGSALLLLLVLIAATMSSRDYRSRQLLIWLRSGQMGLTARLQGEQGLEALGDKVLDFLSGYLDAQVGALYVAESRQRFRRVAGLALPPGGEDQTLRPGESLPGQAAKSGRTLRVCNVPEGYLPISSALGRATPRELLVAPAMVDRRVHAVLELGFLRHIRPEDELLMERVSEALGIAVRASKDRTRLEELLEQSRRQAERLQTQQEELRVTNEELEEQGRALKESQGQLEAQQAELEQTNAQLEEQTQLLEAQRDELAQAQVDLSAKAEDLERASQYKNEFLANMSHELRTPLNSALILAKLLADNKDGNLTPEQVEFAETISSAGNDLLSLINDILDLSKIEAGKVDLVPERVFVKGTVEALMKAVLPVAEQKGLVLHAIVDPGTPERFVTDAGRLAQILRNLLSNALKFTDHGEVSLHAHAGPEGSICFSVSDTGIGIAGHQHELIFEAFRQADGSTHRKYGGTGLGLSISRDLSRLLGGDITVQSILGQGSTFTLTLPLVYAGTKEPAPAVIPPPPVGIPALAPPRVQSTPRVVSDPSRAPRPVRPTRGQSIADDRDRLTAQQRLILVIEDDTRFAGILRDLAHEMSFQCIATHTADDGLAAAAHYSPSAVLLDINLPDHSGLGVLDQLKRNPATRHIPVHVLSVADYAHEALELGAVGYALKPVKREQLVEAFQKLAAKLSQGMRHVLVVEDDARQRDSIRHLLGNRDVEIVDVATASAALAELQARSFDCLVMDLNLPDFSGYELLERMAEQAEGPFPPVIVYTGRSLTSDEEQRLRRFSRSIIIKDARSPERLLDEVTLFLHQVESELPEESQRILKSARAREASFEGRRILVVEDDARNIFALASVFEPKGAEVAIARNGREALQTLENGSSNGSAIDLVLMDIMMPEMDGLTAMREIRKRPEWRKLPIIALTAKAMKDDQERCLAAGANDYIAKPLDVERLLSLARVWMPR